MKEYSARLFFYGYRDKVKIATKLTPFMLSEARDMEKMLDLQLNKLQTDHIDYYLLHGLDADYWDKLQGFGALEFLDKAKADGKIVNKCSLSTVRSRHSKK